MSRRPVRLEKPTTNQSVIDFGKDIVIRISFAAALILAMALFLAICFLVKGPTYGFL